MLFAFCVQYDEVVDGEFIDDEGLCRVISPDISSIPPELFPLQIGISISVDGVSFSDNFYLSSFRKKQIL